MTATPTFILRQPISERHVQAIWYDRSLRPEGLHTVRGIPVRVIDPGIWNVEAGPDFRSAVLEVGPDAQRLTGDVEVHLHPSDWRAHGHSNDLAYAHVIAHVTWHAHPARSPQTDGLPARCLQICLGDFLRTKPSFSPEAIDLSVYPYAHFPAAPRPCHAFFARDPDRLVTLLSLAGRTRLAAKASHFTARFLRTGDPARVFYEETFAALGYKHNVKPFRKLAEILPWHELPANPDAASAALTCAAKMSVAQTAAWHTAHVRPANRPHHRFAAAAALFAGTASTLLPRLKTLDLRTRAGQKDACLILSADGLLGFRRTAALLANVLVPFALAADWLHAPPDWLFPEDLCAPMRLTAFRLLGRDHNPALYAGNGLLLQGLLHVHRAFCLQAHPDCETCALLQSLQNNAQRKDV